MSRLDLYGPDESPDLQAARASMVDASSVALRSDLIARSSTLGVRGKLIAADIARAATASPLFVFLTVRPWAASAGAGRAAVVSPLGAVVCRHADRRDALRCVEARRASGGYERRDPAGCFGAGDL